MNREEYCIYLRKSRKDMDAEAHGEGEPLARYESLLLEAAKREKLNVTEIYREIVSGETITVRPVMLHLLEEVEAGRWAGVLVVEVERLARGNTVDKGIVAQTFQYSGTKIVTPIKTYDLTNEYDEEYFEFGLYMSRREYKAINRRLVRGREAASKEGKWASGSCPYGYKRVRVENGKGWTLEVVPNEAEIVKLIFRLYTQGEPMPDGSIREVGSKPICRILERMNVPAPAGGPEWYGRTIDVILQNPAYIGKVCWNRRRTKRKIENGVVKPERYVSDPENWILVDGLHEAIIAPEIFQQAADKIAWRGPSPIKRSVTLKNAFSGIAVCGKCGRALVLRPHPTFPMLKCMNRAYDNVGAGYSIFEARVIAELSIWLKNYTLEFRDGAAPSDDEAATFARSTLERAKAELASLQKQLTRTHEFLERDIYDVDTFLERSRALSAQIAEAKENVKTTTALLYNAERSRESRKSLIPKVEKLMDIYAELPDAAAKNALLKEVLERIEYRREKRTGPKGPKDNFEITLYPKLPKIGE